MSTPDAVTAGPVTERTSTDGNINVSFTIHSGVPDVRSSMRPVATLRPVRGVAYYAPHASGFEWIALRLWGPAVKQDGTLGTRTHMAEYLDPIPDDAPDWLSFLVDLNRPVGALCTVNTPHPTKPDSASWCTLAALHTSPLHIDREGLVFTSEDADYRRPSWQPYQAADMLRIAADIVDEEIQAGEHDPGEYGAKLRWRATNMCPVHGPACNEEDGEHFEPPTVNGEVV